MLQLEKKSVVIGTIFIAKEQISHVNDDARHKITEKEGWLRGYSSGNHGLEQGRGNGRAADLKPKITNNSAYGRSSDQGKLLQVIYG